MRPCATDEYFLQRKRLEARATELEVRIIKIDGDTLLCEGFFQK